jgi:hypothetical protein
MDAKDKAMTDPVKREDKATGEIIETTGERSMAAATAAAIKRIEAATLLALRNPRDEDVARERILARCSDPQFAEKAIYDLTEYNRGEGFSIRAAEEILVQWGNVWIRQNVVHEDSRSRVVSISVADLQRNITFDKDVTVHKKTERHNVRGREVLGKRLNTKGETVFIVEATEEETDSAEARAASKQIRNLGLRLIPANIKAEAWKVCKDTRKGIVRKDPGTACARMVKAFAEIGVTAAMIADAIGKPAAEATPDELDELLNVFNGINEKEITWTDFADRMKAARKPAGPATATGASGIDDAKYESLIALCGSCGVTPDALRLHMGETYGVVAIRKLDVAVYDEVVAWVKSQKKAK